MNMRGSLGRHAVSSVPRCPLLFRRDGLALHVYGCYPLNKLQMADCLFPPCVVCDDVM